MPFSPVANLPRSSVFLRFPAFPEGNSDLPVQKALGRRPLLDEEVKTAPPPAAAERAETAFEIVSTILLLLMALAAVWILIRKRI